MNIYSIIQGFGKYLRELNNGQNDDFFSQEANISIFNFTSEFKEYLTENYGGYSSIFSSNISELMNMNIVNGQFVNSESIFSEGENNGSMGEILNHLFSNEQVKTLLDTDKNGDLSKEEINVFLQTISGSDNNEQNISIEDILNATELMQNGNFTLNGNLAGLGSAEDPNSETGTEETKKTKSSHHSRKSRSSKDSDDVKEKNLDTMSKSELSAELTNASGSVAEKQNKLDALLSGSDSNLSAMKESVEASYQAYLEQLNTVDKELGGQVNTLKESISAKESEIDSKQAQISKQENTVTDCKTSYDNAVSKRENLESILSELNSTDTSKMDESAKSSIQQKISEVKEKLSQAEQDEKTKKTEWDNAKDELSKLEKEKTELETGENGLDKLKEQMSALESTISTQYPQIQEYLTNYNQQKQTYEQSKASAIESAKAELKTAKDYETKVKTAYQDADNEEDTANYSPIMYNKETAAKIAQLAAKYAKKMDTIGNCLVGVARAIREFLGLKHTALSPLPKAYLAAEQFRNDPVLSKHFKEVQVDRSDLANLPAGAVVVWNKSEGHPAGHISIALGNGKEASDHIQNQMNRKNATYTVFYPV